MRQQSPTGFYWDIVVHRQTPEVQERLAKENAPSVVFREMALALLVPLALAVAIDLFMR